MGRFLASGIHIKNLNILSAVSANLIQGKVQPFFPTVRVIGKPPISYMTLMGAQSSDNHRGNSSFPFTSHFWVHCLFQMHLVTKLFLPSSFPLSLWVLPLLT